MIPDQTECPCGILFSSGLCVYHNKPAEEDECLNCGMIDVPLEDGYCEGCICSECGYNAGETGSSMNDMGMCDTCADGDQA